MPYKDLSKRKEYKKEYDRKTRGYLRGDRPINFSHRFPHWEQNLKTLTPKQQYIVVQYYGLESEPVSLQTIANHFGCTREAIRQDRERAEKTLTDLENSEDQQTAA